ncbi:hypothetical protein V5O48_006743 [Marasmius crinis-equi]|uniref:Uncharacterized protein n=1 Tax=Marasmius crinis-equi TaxID=585013 RepID=A0ABR3FIV7_9AGAR
MDDSEYSNVSSIYSSTETQSSASTIIGLGYLSGRAIKRLGEAVLNGIDYVLVNRQLRRMESYFAGQWDEESSDTRKMCRLLIEFTDPGYILPVRTRALSLIMTQIGAVKFKGLAGVLIDFASTSTYRRHLSEVWNFAVGIGAARKRFESVADQAEQERDDNTLAHLPQSDTVPFSSSHISSVRGAYLSAVYDGNCTETYSQHLYPVLRQNIPLILYFDFVVSHSTGENARSILADIGISGLLESMSLFDATSKRAGIDPARASQVEKSARMGSGTDDEDKRAQSQPVHAIDAPFRLTPNRYVQPEPTPSPPVNGVNVNPADQARSHQGRLSMFLPHNNHGDLNKPDFDYTVPSSGGAAVGIVELPWPFRFLDPPTETERRQEKEQGLEENSGSWSSRSSHKSKSGANVKQGMSVSGKEHRLKEHLRKQLRDLRPQTPTRQASHKRGLASAPEKQKGVSTKPQMQGSKVGLNVKQGISVPGVERRNNPLSDLSDIDEERMFVGGKQRARSRSPEVENGAARAGVGSSRHRPEESMVMGGTDDEGAGVQTLPAHASETPFKLTPNRFVQPEPLPPALAPGMDVNSARRTTDGAFIGIGELPWPFRFLDLPTEQERKQQKEQGREEDSSTWASRSSHKPKSGASVQPEPPSPPSAPGMNANPAHRGRSSIFLPDNHSTSNKPVPPSTSNFYHAVPPNGGAVLGIVELPWPFRFLDLPTENERDQQKDQDREENRSIQSSRSLQKSKSGASVRRGMSVPSKKHRLKEHLRKQLHDLRPQTPTRQVGPEVWVEHRLASAPEKKKGVLTQPQL